MFQANLSPHSQTGGTESELDMATLDVLASIRIRAEFRRVLYALAMPEYMEAWLMLPDVDRIECHSERRSYDRFRIDLFYSGSRQRCIYGACLLSKPNRITYLWERDYGGSLARSTADIHLLSSPSACTVKLRHSGLSSKDDREWISKVWNRSLANLRILMEAVNPNSLET
jgi:hypothetical protein